MDNRNVFVIHGRNENARSAMFQFLRSLGLHPLEWSQIVHATGKGSPYIGEVLDKGFEIAQAIIVLMTPDDVAKLREAFQHANEPPFESELTGQPRQNVIFEAGMAMGKHEDRTIIVELGELRPMSDIHGRHLIRMNNSVARRHDLAQRLETAGCMVDRKGTDWHNDGDFVACLPEPNVDEGSDASDFISYRGGLSNTELYWLAQAVAKREQTIHGYINDNTPKALATKGFLERVGPDPTNKHQPLLYNIPPRVWTYLIEQEVSLLEQAIAKNEGQMARLPNLRLWLEAAKGERSNTPQNQSAIVENDNALEAERFKAQNEADAIQLAQLRQALIYHADHVPAGTAYGPNAGMAWYRGADTLVDGISSMHIKNIFHRSFGDEHEIQIAAATLRAIASRVQAKDLHK